MAKVFFISLLLFGLLPVESCRKINELKKDPELIPLQQGFKVSAAIGYCASLASMAFNNQPLPDNVIFEQGGNSQYSSSGLIFVNVDESHPLPFNRHIGQVIIGGLWDNTAGGGVISIIFGDLDILSAEIKFYGIHTVPIIRKTNSDDFLTVFAEQDIIVGAGSDTIINLGLSRVAFDTELDRLDKEQPNDIFTAVKQNVWFVNIDQHNTFPDLYDDDYLINGGGQILEATSTSGGVVYHALIETAYTYGTCNINPVNGAAFIQNIKAGTGVDLGNIILDFHSTCDGKASVRFASGEYLTSNGRDVNLNFN